MYPPSAPQCFFWIRNYFDYRFVEGLKENRNILETIFWVVIEKIAFFFFFFCEIQNKGNRVPSTHGRFPLRPLPSVIRQDKPMCLTATEMK